MATFFTADYHFDHAAIIKYCKRPFTSVEDMNEAIIARNNAVVRPEDTLWILGDIAFVNTKERLLKLLARLNGKKRIVLGNHDNPAFANPSREEADAANIVSVNWRLVELRDKEFAGFHPTLSHFPMISWEKSFHGSFNLHGHEHGAGLVDPLARRMDVGVDCHNFTPVSWTKVVNRLSKIPTPKEQGKREE